MSSANYASSHDTVRLSAKRYEQSPYAGNYQTDETVFGLYARRFYPLTIGDNAIANYWTLRRDVGLFDVPEKPLEIKGPDAVKLLELAFTRRIEDLKLMRARYAVACTAAGGILMDGVLIRLGEDHFYYVQADGEILFHLQGLAQGMDVEVNDPGSWVLQVQGPKALEVLRSAAEGVPEKLGYFHVAKVKFGGQELLISRTGWTGEMGFEIYSSPTTDHDALWAHLMKHGEAFGMTFSALEAMGIRRLEAGILDNGTDIDPTMTPYEAGLGSFVDLSKENFVGKAALETANQQCLLMGLSCDGTVPFANLKVLDGNLQVGTMTAGAWSPFLDKGIGYARFKDAGDWIGKKMTLVSREGNAHEATVVTLPFYDEKKLIPRGLA
jgi:glycine cleavage system aminomethyltransferase T